MLGVVNIAEAAMQSVTKEFEFSGIYQLLNVKNGKRYVGQAKNIANRIREHRRNRNGITANPESRLYRATKKYGWDAFQWSVLERVDDLSLLDAREKFWIETLGTCGRDAGYNIHSDPKTTRGWTHSAEAKGKIAAAKAGQFCGSANPFFGKTHTEETKSKIGAANSARPRTDEERSKLKEARKTSGAGRKARRIAQIDPETDEIIKEWESVSDVCRTLGASIGSIVGCCKRLRGRRTSNGYKWAYLS